MQVFDGVASTGGIYGYNAYLLASLNQLRREVLAGQARDYSSYIVIVVEGDLRDSDVIAGGAGIE